MSRTTRLEVEDAVPAAGNGTHAVPTPVAEDPGTRDQATPESEQQTDTRPAGAMGNLAVEQNDADDLEEWDITRPTDEEIDALIPLAPPQPDTTQFEQLFKDHKARDKGQGDEINRDHETATIKLPLMVQQANAVRNRIKTRIKTSWDRFNRAYPGLRAKQRKARQRTKAAKLVYGRLRNEFEGKLSADGFNPHVPATLEGITQAIQTHPKVAGLSAPQETSPEPIIATASTTPPGQDPDPTTAVPQAVAEPPHEPSAAPEQEGTEPEEDTTSPPVAAESTTETESTAAHAGTPLVPPVKPEPISPPEQPSVGGRAGWSLGEMAITVLLSGIIGMVFGAAFITALSSAITIQQVEQCRSGIGNLFVFLIGPTLVLIMGEIYKKTTSEFVQLGNPHIKQDRHNGPSHLVLFVVATVIFLFSLADIKLTANLFRQTFIENNIEFGKDHTPPEYQFFLWGLLLSTPLMVLKTMLGYRHGLEECRVWNQWVEEKQRIKDLNEAATAAYEAQKVQYQQDCDAAQRRNEAAAQAERQEREDVEARQREAAEATKQAQQEARDQEARAAAERDAEARRREQRVNDVRANNQTIKEVTGLLPGIDAAAAEVTRCETEERKIQDRIALLAGELALTPKERRDIAKADLAIMLTTNEAYRGICGTTFFDDEALDEERTIVNAPVAPSNGVPAA